MLRARQRLSTTRTRVRLGGDDMDTAATAADGAAGGGGAYSGGGGGSGIIACARRAGEAPLPVSGHLNYDEDGADDGATLLARSAVVYRTVMRSYWRTCSAVPL